MSRLTAFKPGPIEDSGLCIIECLNFNHYSTSLNTYYKVKYNCCGDEGILIHRSITRRVYRKSLLCKKCADNVDGNEFSRIKAISDALEVQEIKSIILDKELDNYGFISPPWPVPPSVVVIPHVKSRGYYQNQC